MRKSLLYFAAFSLLLAGCAKEQLVEEKLSNGVVTEVSATFEELVPDGATKASVEINGTAGVFSWQDNDAAAFILDTKTDYGKGTYNANSKLFQIQGSANSHYDAVYPYDLVDSSSSFSESITVTSVTVPASRSWEEDQTNVSMYGSYSESGYQFKHLGGLVMVTVVNVPVDAKKFVFKTTGKKITGTFTVTENESGENVIKTNSTPAEGEDTYTLNLPATITANSTMEFYVPLPVGEDYVFSFYLKDDGGNDLAKVEGTTKYDVNRKSILVMPTITLAQADIEDIYKSATIQEVSAGHNGDVVLAKSEKVILKLNSGNSDNDITLKYQEGANLPTNLQIEVVGDGHFEKKISGTLPQTHVDFTQGEIANVEMTTSANTFEIIYPARITEKLTVTGGNVTLKGAKVAAIEVAQEATADGGSTPVKITLADYTPAVTEEEPTPVAQTPEVVAPIVANANVTIDPAKDVEVFVKKGENVEVTTASGQDKGDVITIGEDAVVMIGSDGYDSLAEAISNVTNGQTIKVLQDIDDADGISVAKNDNDNKKFTVDFGGHTYTCLDNPTGSTNTANQVFQLNTGNTITFKNGTIKVAETNNTKFRFIIQNYCDLTLEDMTLDGANLALPNKVCYTVSNNCGTVEFKNTTSIKAPTNGVAFDVCLYDDEGTYPAPTVTVNTTGTIEGQVEVTGGNLFVNNGTFTSVM